MVILMSNKRQANTADDLALVNIVLDYTRGHSLEEITLRLKEQCLKFNMACKARYQAIKHGDKRNLFDEGVNKILDELAVGGSQLHIMTVNQARIEEKFNCYVWDESTSSLTYLQYKKDDVSIALRDNAPLVRFIDILKKPRSLHLNARQIEQLITSNHSLNHLPQHTAQPSEINDYKSCQNLYDVLKTLEKKHPHLTVLIEKINDARPPRNWWLYLLFATGMTAITGFMIYLKENFDVVRAWYERTLPIVSRLLNNTVYLLSKTPLIGVISHGLPLIWSWYQAIKDGSITEAKKIIQLSFQTIEHTLPIVGYLLCYLAAGVMTGPAVALFITGATIEILASLYDLIYHQVEPWFNPLAPATEYHSAKAMTYANNARERNLYTSLIKIVSNLLTTASIVVWCLFPPSLTVALICMLFSTLVNMTKASLVSRIQTNSANALQADLKDISDQYNVSHHTEESIEILELRQKIDVVNNENCQLKAQIKTYKDIVSSGLTIKNRMGFFGTPATNDSAANDSLGLDNDNNSETSYNSNIS